jgi:hypothetical protein
VSQFNGSLVLFGMTAATTPAVADYGLNQHFSKNSFLKNASRGGARPKNAF